MIRIVAVVLCAAIAHAAKPIEGIDSLSIGRWAGLDGQADRTVVIGPGSGAYMRGGDSNLYVGAASGLRTENVQSSVGVGHYAFRGATNCSKCVGIGDLVFSGANNCTNEIRINGQIHITPTNIVIRPTPENAIICWNKSSDTVRVNSLFVGPATRGNDAKSQLIFAPYGGDPEELGKGPGTIVLATELENLYVGPVYNLLHEEIAYKLLGDQTTKLDVNYSGFITVEKYGELVGYIPIVSPEDFTMPANAEAK